jgi:C1A family cysteine protease
METQKHAYGWVPSLPDFRDKQVVVSTSLGAPMVLPSMVNLRKFMPPIVDQGDLGSCTANSIAAALWYEECKQRGDTSVPILSRLFIYYNERALTNTIRQDSGASIRDSLKAIAKKGACPEEEWPYDIKKFTKKPKPGCFDYLPLYGAKSYAAVRQDLVAVRSVLAQGHPVAIGFTVFSSLENEDVQKTGVIPFPTRGDSMLGGHAVLLVGYNDAAQQFMFRNSWGEGWGDEGYGYMPYWCIQTV